MAIDNAQAIKFSNEQVRTVANALAQTYYAAKRVRDQWYALNLGALFPVDGGDVLDGAATDGRPIITGNAVTLLITRCDEIITSFEASSNAKLNTILAIATQVE